MITRSIEWQQLVRFQRMRDQRFYLIDLIRNKNKDKETEAVSDGRLNFQFKVSGSTANLYTVDLTISDGLIELKCDCPDMSSWAEIHGCKCKHCCFVWERVLALKPETICVLKEAMDESPKDWNTLIEMTRGACQHLRLRQELTNQTYQAKYRQATKESHAMLDEVEERDDTPCTPFDIIGEIQAELDCPICFEDLSRAADCVQCPTCRNPIHITCMKKWLGMGKQSCVYCRSEEWSNFASILQEKKSGRSGATSSTYLNLNL